MLFVGTDCKPPPAAARIPSRGRIILPTLTSFRLPCFLYAVTTRRDSRGSGGTDYFVCSLLSSAKSPDFAAYFKLTIFIVLVSSFYFTSKSGDFAERGWEAYLSITSKNGFAPETRYAS